MANYRSWAFIPRQKQKAIKPSWNDINLNLKTKSILPHGNARSYGDSCLNSEGLIIDTRNLNRFINFDSDTGLLKCEPGILFADILALVVPKNWMLPVTPGTKFVTLGGAIANDVHGKNHHKDGTLGNHITRLELIRSDGEKIICSKKENQEMFAATIGGLGLTGFINWAEIQLLRIPSPYLKVETTAFYGLDQFYKLSQNANNNHRYSVAWLDCASNGNKFGRGLFMSADHVDIKKPENPIEVKPKLSIPFNFPKKLINRYTVRAFNSLYFHKNRLTQSGITYQHYDSFFYPLDNIANWNRIYGKEGFYQYQFVIPSSEKSTMDLILNKIIDSGMGSFLAVLKEFGDIPPSGILSFPRPGICLALDFANRGQATKKLIVELDQLVMGAGGACYPAKDLSMSSTAFKSYFPNFEKFKEYIDPKFSSDFWRRVTKNG